MVKRHYLPMPGPWMRTDGNPFADTIDKLVGYANNGQVFTPPQYDENHNLVASASIFTATYQDGTKNTDFSNTTCVDWSSNASAFVWVGDSSSTSQQWTSAAGGNCSITNHLICMQTGVGPALPSRSIPAGAKQVFITSDFHDANLSGWPGAVGSGIAAGDAICQDRATTKGLPNANKFKAWLSDGSTDAITRLTFNGPWYRLDGIKVADSQG